MSRAVSSRGGVSRAVSGRGGVSRHTVSGRGGVRRSGGRYGYGYNPRYYRSFYYRSRDCYYYGYPSRLGIGIGIGVGIGFGLAYWDPYYYSCYGNYWVNGCPPFGFGNVYYGPSYQSYFSEPVYVPPTSVVVEGAPVEVAPPEAPFAPEVPPEEQAPGEADFGSGVDAFLAGNYAGALKFFKRAAQADENNGEAWMAIAQSAFAVGVFDEAADAIARAALLGAFPRGYRHDPLPMYPAEGRFEALLDRLQKFRTKYPDYADAHLVAAYFHVALGQKTQANEAIVQLLQQRPGDETAPILTLAMLPPLPPAANPEIPQTPEALEAEETVEVAE